MCVTMYMTVHHCSTQHSNSTATGLKSSVFSFTIAQLRCCLLEVIAALEQNIYQISFTGTLHIGMCKF